MDIYVTRDSVAAGDDARAPHRRTFSFPDAMPIMEIIKEIASCDYLASIASGNATWSAVSGFPIAVVAQQWTEPRSATWRPISTSELENRNGVVCIHFNYHTQLDPNIVHQVLGIFAYMRSNTTLQGKALRLPLRFVP